MHNALVLYKCNDVMKVNPMLAKPESNVYTFNTARNIDQSIKNSTEVQNGTGIVVTFSRKLLGVET